MTGYLSDPGAVPGSSTTKLLITLLTGDFYFGPDTRRGYGQKKRDIRADIPENINDRLRGTVINVEFF